MLGAFKVNTWVALLATTGVILSAGYALWLYRRVMFGELDARTALRHIVDMTPREVVVLGPLIALTIFFGFYPVAALDVTAASVDNLINRLRGVARRLRRPR